MVMRCKVIVVTHHRVGMDMGGGGCEADIIWGVACGSWMVGVAM